MKTLLLLLASICFVTGTFAQYNVPGKLKLYGDFQELRSTHGDFFDGGSITLDKVLSPHWEVGIGIEHSYNDYHDDNGWKLYNLRFIPAYGDVKYQFLPTKRFSPFLHASVGWTFINYDKQPDATAKTFHVSESGLYAWGGGGAAFAINHHWGISAEAGIKNFHLSSYDLEVNPHGVAGRVGLMYQF